jgi:hypothetical protein
MALPRICRVSAMSASRSGSAPVPGSLSASAGATAPFVGSPFTGHPASWSSPRSLRQRRVFKKIWAESWGPRMEYILRNALLALLDLPASTLLDIPRLLDDMTFRRHILAYVRNDQVRRFWLREYENYPVRFRAEAIGPIQNKVGEFLVNQILRNIVGQPKSAFDLRRVMDEGKTLLVNLAKGKIGEDTSSLLGAMLVTKISLAALSRAELSERDRCGFYLYADEFPSFTVAGADLQALRQPADSRRADPTLLRARSWNFCCRHNRSQDGGLSLVLNRGQRLASRMFPPPVPVARRSVRA